MASIFENISHEKRFPAKIFVTQVDHSDFHWHHDYEVIFVIKGSVLTYCGSQPTTLSAGDLFLFNSHDIHGIQRTTSDNLLVCLQFSPKLIINDLEDEQFSYRFYMNSTDDELLPEKPYSYFRNKLAQIMSLSFSPKNNSTQLKICSLLLSFVADLIDYVPFDIHRMPLITEEDPVAKMYSRILKYINDNLTLENLTEQLHREFGLSEKTLYRYLKNTLGVTLKELIDITRIEKASSMLKETDKTISFIWQTCGFSSEVSFYRNFKKHMGITPTDYRKAPSNSISFSTGDNYVGFNFGEAAELLYHYLEEETELL